MTDAEKRLREAIECVGPFACRNGDHEFLQADIAALLDEVTRLRKIVKMQPLVNEMGEVIAQSVKVSP